ncbi:unnamed protein product, partial [Pelagomonas calceolata]
MRQTQGSALAQLSQVFAAQLLATQAQKNTRADTKKTSIPRVMMSTLATSPVPVYYHGTRELTLAVLLALRLTGWHSSAKLSLRLALECQAPRGSPGWAPAVGRRIAKNAA